MKQSLTSKQKKVIRNQARAKSARRIARELNLELRQVEEYLSTVRPPLSKNRQALFLFMTLLIPVLFFVLLETGLRWGQYRGDTRLFVFPEEFFDGKYGFANTHFNARYFFNTTTLPGFSNDVFLAEKPDSSFRIFVMGGSTAAGYPYGFNGIFSRVTADALQDVLPGYLVEVVNIGTSAVNTYTLYDQIPEILRYEPDAIFIYAGHNEFYGALGVGSSEQFGAYPGFVRYYLKLQRFKTFMLVRDVIASISKTLSSLINSHQSPPEGGTLMQRMVQNQSITLESKTFEMGKNQFRSNLDRILKRFQEEQIPVFIGSLASNLKDQPPFISVETGQHPGADLVFRDAKRYYEQQNYEQAYSAFSLARDLDALKFRAPSVFNDIIRTSAAARNAHYVPVYESMRQASINNITGFDFMLEHLHPNRDGYFLMGKVFYEAMENTGYLGRHATPGNKRDWQEYYDRMTLSELDEKIVWHRIRFLTTGWPFLPKRHEQGYPFNYQPQNKVDELAFQVVHSDKRWDQAKIEIAEHYIAMGYFEKAIFEYEGLIRDQPYNDSPYVYAGRLLLQVMQDFERAKSYFEKAYSLNPTSFTTRMLGSIEVNDGHYERGIRLLNEALRFNPNDAQALFNLSGAHALSGDFHAALDGLNRLEQIHPGFPGMAELRQQVEWQLRQR